MGVSRAGIEKMIAIIGTCVCTIIGVNGAEQRNGTSAAPATKVSSPNLEISSYVTQASDKRGARISVVLDITPGPGIHVYAPEVQGYRPIRLTIQPRAGIIVSKARYPKSEDYFFEALDEHVPVYQTPFQIVQDLMIDASAKGKAALAGLSSLTIKGVLEYQACDDKICFRAQSVPLSWEVKLGPRAPS
jgi:DsbC/DsbD-like thiol-disulfide interchange protein